MAEAFLTSVQADPNILTICKQALESPNSFVQFHSSVIIKQVICRNTSESKNEWIHYLTLFLIQRNSTLERFVKTCVLNSIATLLKTNLINSDNYTNSGSEIILFIQKFLLSNCDPLQIHIGLELVVSVVNQFADNKHTGIAIPLQIHRKLQRTFQEDCLHVIFALVVQNLEKHVENSTELDMRICQAALACSDLILNWDFNDCYSHVMDSKPNPDLEKLTNEAPLLTDKWRAILMFPGFLQLFFNVILI